ncbi:hypothetical protein GCM10023238_05680 [Streptomyces heliomycini]
MGQLIAPLAAAGAGALTVSLVSEPSFELSSAAVRAARLERPAGVPRGGLGGALLGLCAVYAFPFVHGAFARLRHPNADASGRWGGAGRPGALGGHLTLFKGLDEIAVHGARPRRLVARASSPR